MHATLKIIDWATGWPEFTGTMHVPGERKALDMWPGGGDNWETCDLRKKFVDWGCMTILV